MDWTHKGNFLSGNKRSKEEIESLVPTKKINITNGRQYCKLKPTTYTEINFSRNNNFDVGKDYLLNNKENMDFYLQTIVPVINGVAEYTDSKVKVVQ